MKPAEENLQKLQEKDMPEATEWARRTDSSFSAEKTEGILLTRHNVVLAKPPYLMPMHLGRTWEGGRM